MVAVLHLDPNGVIKAANAAAIELLGECVGRRCCDGVLARGPRHQLVCNTLCFAGLSGATPSRDVRGIEIRGQMCRMVCVGGELPAVLITPLVDLTDVPLRALTPRQQEVLTHIARGLSTAETATAMGIGTATVATHLEGARDRLGAKTRAQAVARAILTEQLT